MNEQSDLVLHVAKALQASEQAERGWTWDDCSSIEIDGWMDLARAAIAALSAQPDAGSVGDARARLDNEAPARIWLQIDTAGDNDERDVPWPGSEHVTWQDESIGGLEVEYVRADLAARQPVGVEPVVEIGECAEVLWLQGGPCQLPPGAKLYAAPPAAVPVDVYAAYETWPADIRAKLSLHDLRRMSGVGGEVPDCRLANRHVRRRPDPGLQGLQRD